MKLQWIIIHFLHVLVILAYYFGGKQYATDTANVINGKFTFEGNKELKGGMYLVILSESNYFEVILDYFGLFHNYFALFHGNNATPHWNN